MCRAGLVVLALGLASLGAVAADARSGPPMYALIVGGGPDEDDNAAQIEGHARYVGHLLPAQARRIVLFADGKSDGAKVSYTDVNSFADARRAMGVLLPKTDVGDQPRLRPLNLGLPLDGAARLPDIRRAVSALASEAAARPAPILLYFAGHGSQTDDRQSGDYDLWDGGLLHVRDVAGEVARLPRRTPVVLVMAQCFSGAFGDVLFARGDAQKAPIDQDFAGFFSARRDREASGCSWETGAADYQDFSSYFFGALSGHDRFGHAVTGADYDADGRVSLHEAFCYALIHDASADTPLCTSDVFLERFSSLPLEKILAEPYPAVAALATPAQREALAALSQRLELSGDDRALAAHDRLTFGDPIARPAQLKAEDETTEQLDSLRQTTLAGLFKHWPDLRWPDGKSFPAALDGATKELAKNPQLCRDILDAEQASDEAGSNVDDEEADLLRFTTLYASIVRAQDVRQHGTPAVKAWFERLWHAEQQTLPLGDAGAARPASHSP